MTKNGTLATALVILLGPLGFLYLGFEALVIAIFYYGMAAVGLALVEPALPFAVFALLAGAAWLAPIFQISDLIEAQNNYVRRLERDTMTAELRMVEDELWRTSTPPVLVEAHAHAH